MLTKFDLEILDKKGISQDDIREQLNHFIAGFPFLDIVASASVGKGIMKVSEESKYLSAWDNYRALNRRIVKFVPASGAASRMFKTLFEFIDAEYEESQKDTEKKFFDNIDKFAFYEELDRTCRENDNKSIKEILKDKQYKTVVRNLLRVEGLNYGNLPKGLLLFHKYEDSIRTPVEEHLTEGALYAKNHDKTVNIHFTVSPDHHILFDNLIREKKEKYEQKLDVKYHINFSEQKPKTDTIAVDMNNEPFREEDQLVFRPGGHGALIENLNDLDADIIFIKNIDNVVLDAFKDNEAKYKKILAGVLVDIQTMIFSYLGLIDSGYYTGEQLNDILNFTKNTLNIEISDDFSSESELVSYLTRKLNRPIRVCGMVKNVGEPGGGPFIVVNNDGTSSTQILESSQIDMNNPEKKDMFEKGTHFNPVDLVCGVKDYKGEKFDLKEYIDKNTGFISVKSKGGKVLKALELPGLWNGAMSDWNTIFVEVPIETFNPVKVVNDLLRKEHQGV